MYTIYADGELVWSSTAGDIRTGLVDPIVKKEANQSGSLEFSIHPTHPMYDRLEPFKTKMKVLRDGELFYEGRVLTVQKDFDNQKTVTCEGPLGYLNDTYLAPSTKTETPEQHFRRIIDEHNAQCEDYKRFTVGEVTVTDELGSVEFKSTGYRNTKTAIDDDLIDKYECFVRVRNVDDTYYIDLLEKFPEETGQKIQFGVNMLDMQDDTDDSEVCTVMIPLGKNNLTVESVNNKSKEIKIDSLYEKYGRLVKIVNFNEVSSAADLLKKANKYIEKKIIQKPVKELTLTALDFYDLGYDDFLGFEIGQTISILSGPHDVDLDLMLKSMEIHLDAPDESTYTVGKPDPKGEARVGISSAASTITKSTTIFNDYLKERIKVEDRNVTIIGDKLGIDFDEITFDGGKVKYDKITNMDVIFDTLKIDADSPDGKKGQFEDWNAHVSTTVKQMETFYEKVRKTSFDPEVSDWSTLIENFTNQVVATAEGLSVEIKRVDTYVNDERELTNSLQTQITANAEGLTTKVSAGDVASAINQTAQSVKIQASKIDLEGYVTADELDATNANITNLTSGVTTASSLKTSLLTVNGEMISNIRIKYLLIGDTALRVYSNSADSLTLNASNLPHYHDISVSDTGTVTIGEVSFTPGNFNIADTLFYKNGVSAAESAGREAGAKSVKVSAVGQMKAPTLDGTTYTLHMRGAASNGEYLDQDISLDASAVYNAGADEVTAWSQIVSVTDQRKRVDFYLSNGREYHVTVLFTAT